MSCRSSENRSVRENEPHKLHRAIHYRRFPFLWLGTWSAQILRRHGERVDGGRSGHIAMLVLYVVAETSQEGTSRRFLA